MLAIRKSTQDYRVGLYRTVTDSMLGRASNGKLLLSMVVSVPFAVEVRKMMPSTSQPQCWICGEAPPTDCKIDEEGHAVHDECYARQTGA